MEISDLWPLYRAALKSSKLSYCYAVPHLRKVMLECFLYKSQGSNKKNHALTFINISTIVNEGIFPGDVKHSKFQNIFFPIVIDSLIF